MRNLQYLGKHLLRNEMLTITGGRASRAEYCLLDGYWCLGPFFCCVDVIRNVSYCCPEGTKCDGMGGCMPG